MPVYFIFVKTKVSVLNAHTKVSKLCWAFWTSLLTDLYYFLDLYLFGLIEKLVENISQKGDDDGLDTITETDNEDAGDEDPSEAAGPVTDDTATEDETANTQDTDDEGR